MWASCPGVVEGAPLSINAFLVTSWFETREDALLTMREID
jgi:hypothetical protein